MKTNTKLAPSDVTADYAPFEGGNGEWGVVQGNTVIYDACCGFDEATATLMAEIMNEGRGLDAWCESDDPSADLLRDRLLERGWVDPMEHRPSAAAKVG